MKYALLAWVVIFSLNGNIAAQSIKPFNESAPHFNSPTIIDSSRGIFSTKDMYRAYRKASTGFTTMTKTQAKLEDSIRNFANEKGKSFIVLGTQTLWVRNP